MRTDKLKGSIEASQDSLKKLQEAIGALRKSSPPQRELFRDALVKRFESAFEYCWRMLKAAAEFQGTEATGPRPAILEGVRYGWIADPDWWATCLDTRNESVHDYFGTSRKGQEETVFRFTHELETLIEKISGLLEKGSK